MKKFVVTILILLTCSGCTEIKYKLNLSENVINEQINAYDESYHNSYQSNIEIGDISAFEYFFQSLPYRSTGDGRGNYHASKDYNSFSNFLDESFIFSKFYNKEDIKVSGGKVKINLKINEQLDRYILNSKMKSLQISLYVPYHVSKHNADVVSNNTYTWNFDDLETANLKINFDMSKSYKYKGFLSSMIIIGIFSVIITVIVIYFIKQNKNVNKI